jgi:hypothetical protein
VEYERLAQQAHDAAIAELQREWPLNDMTYASRYAEKVQTFFAMRRMQPRDS